MTDIFDYLVWRGDLKISQAPFNNVDALLLSRLSFLPFDGIVSGDPLRRLSIGAAAALFFALPNVAQIVNMALDIRLLHSMAASERFRDMPLSAYVNDVDYQTQKQFAALVIGTGDGSHFISYRGTDSTLVGWKEDFNMTFMTPVPAQKQAVDYLEAVAAVIPGPLRLGGHSKGGNLAVYAAAFAAKPVRKRITAVYNNDGPGLDSTVIAQQGYADISRRIRTFVPQSSVVGMLLEHEEEYQIVHSRQIGLLQHDLYSWEVLRDDFILLEGTSNSSRFLDRTLKDWMMSVAPEQREQFIDAVFSVFSETEAATFRDLISNWHKNAHVVLKSLKNMDEATRQVTARTLFALIDAAKRNVSLLKRREGRQ